MDDRENKIVENSSHFVRAKLGTDFDKYQNVTRINFPKYIAVHDNSHISVTRDPFGYIINVTIMVSPIPLWYTYVDPQIGMYVPAATEIPLKAFQEIVLVHELVHLHQAIEGHNLSERLATWYELEYARLRYYNIFNQSVKYFDNA